MLMEILFKLHKKFKIKLLELFEVIKRDMRHHVTFTVFND